MANTVRLVDVDGNTLATIRSAAGSVLVVQDREALRLLESVVVLLTEIKGLLNDSRKGDRDAG